MEQLQKILEQNNQARLDEPLSATEFNQVKKLLPILIRLIKLDNFYMV